MGNYPLELSFNIATICTRVRVVDATGRQVAYLRKKKFRLKEDVRVYEDDDQSRPLFRIRAHKVEYFGASYAVSGPTDCPSGQSDSRACALSGRAATRSRIRTGRRSA